MINQLSISLVLFALAASQENNLDDSELSQAIKDGDHKAFKLFYDEHYDSLLYFLLSRNTDQANAEDLIQKAFMYIWENRDQIDTKKSLRAFIFRIAYTRMLNFHRDTKKFNDDEVVPEQQDSITPEDKAREKDLEQAIDRAISQMPEKRGEVFTLCFIEQFTYKETAEMLDVSPKTVENHMGRALKDIRKSLEKFR